MIGVIVLAAGRSRRMGEGVQKLLLPLAGKAIVAHVVDQLLAALDSATSEVVVVTPVENKSVTEVLAGRSVIFAANPDPDSDMLGSIRVGLRALSTSCAGVMVAPGDLPQVTPAIVRRLVDAFRASPDLIVVPIHHGRRGHPIVFPAAMRDEVLTRFDGEGLRGLLQAHPAAVLEVPVDSAAIIEDIDQPEDYQRARNVIPSPGTPGEGGIRSLKSEG